MKNMILDRIKEINQSQTNIELNDLDCKTKTRKNIILVKFYGLFYCY